MVRSINPSNLRQHVNPIPAAAAHGGLIASSAIVGVDPESGDYPTDKAVQIQLAFDELGRVLAAAGITADDVIRIDLYLADLTDRTLVNPHWLALYPDPERRPARKAHPSVMTDNCCLQIMFLAVDSSGR